MKTIVKSVLFSLVRKLAFFYHRVIRQKYLAYTADFYTGFYRKQIKHIGEGVYFNGSVHISDMDGMCIGNNVHIGKDCYFYSRGGIAIGDNTHLSRNIAIYSANHNYSGSSLPYDDTYSLKPVSIGKNVWIGMNVSILPGVTIGDGAIIGMGAVVAHDVPAMSVMGATSAVHIKDRNTEQYHRLENSSSYGGRSGRPVPFMKQKLFKVHAGSLETNMVFALSADTFDQDSGSHIFKNYHSLECVINPRKQIRHLALLYLQGQIDEKRIKCELETMYLKCATIDRHLNTYIEWDQKNAYLIPFFHDILPRARFLWIVRDPFEFIYFAKRKSWFSGQRDQIPHPSAQAVALPAASKARKSADGSCPEQNELFGSGILKSEWHEMSQLERMCCYWNHYNSHVEHHLLKLKDGLYLRIGMDCGQVDHNKIAEFLGAGNISLNDDGNGVKPKGRQLELAFSPDERRQIRKLCDAGIKKWLKTG